MKRIIAIIFIGLVLGSCDQQTLFKQTLEKIIPQEDDKFARAYLEALRNNEIQSSISKLNHQLVNSETEEKLSEVASFLQNAPPVSIELIAGNIDFKDEIRQTNLTYQYEFTDSWLVATITIQTIDEHQEVLGIHVNPIQNSLSEINAFTFSGKSIQHYLVFCYAILTILFIIFTLLVCIKTKIKKRKWLCILLILFGIGQLSFNWTTGRIGLDTFSISIKLFGTSMARQGLYAPWIISISVPIGAIIFLLKRKKLQNSWSSPNKAVEQT